MRRIAIFVFILFFLGTTVFIVLHFWQKEEISFYEANDERIHYVGRFDFSDKDSPKAWAPGTYLEFESEGTSCEIVVEDEVKFGNTHNYLEIVLDHGKTKRIRLGSRINRIQLYKDAKGGKHHVLVCKNTESAIGFIKINGIYCQKLCKWKKPRKRLFEFIGDSITCGNGADQSSIPFGKGSWYDYHNAYLSYGARLARERNADWVFTATTTNPAILKHHDCSPHRRNLRAVPPTLWPSRSSQQSTTIVCNSRSRHIYFAVARWWCNSCHSCR